jgi:hypothetical protein
MREGENLLPQFPVPHNESEDSWLIKQANLGLAKKMDGKIPANYQERLNFELDVMIKMGFPGYFFSSCRSLQPCTRGWDSSWARTWFGSWIFSFIRPWNYRS